MQKYDVIILTESRYVKPEKPDWFIQNILQEDHMVKDALEKRGYTVLRTNWDNSDIDWSETGYALFRTTWDYFDRFTEFDEWLNRVRDLTSFINPIEIITWNLDKHYLQDLKNSNINIPPTLYIEKGTTQSLREIFSSAGWNEAILKPVISGGARHTYRLRKENTAGYEELFKDLIHGESMMLQEFQKNVINAGEIALMIFNGKFTHAVLKRAKPGDFRVQDDFGGSVEDYQASEDEISFAERVVASCQPLPVYARVDIIRDNHNQPCVSELELIEPELWFRRHPQAVESFADAVSNHMKKGGGELSG